MLSTVISWRVVLLCMGNLEAYPDTEDALSVICEPEPRLDAFVIFPKLLCYVCYVGAAAQLSLGGLILYSSDKTTKKHRLLVKIMHITGY